MFLHKIKCLKDTPTLKLRCIRSVSTIAKQRDCRAEMKKQSAPFLAPQLGDPSDLAPQLGNPSDLAPQLGNPSDLVPQLGNPSDLINQRECLPIFKTRKKSVFTRPICENLCPIYDRVKIPIPIPIHQFSV